MLDVVETPPKPTEQTMLFRKRSVSARFIERWLGPVGLALILVGLAAVQTAFRADPRQARWYESLHWYAALLATVSIVSYVAGLPNLRRGAVERAVATLVATAVGVGALAVLTLAQGRGGLVPRRSVLLAVAVLAPAWLYLVSDLACRRLAQGQRQDRVLLIAEENEHTGLALELRGTVERNADLTGAYVLGSVPVNRAGSAKCCRRASRQSSSLIRLHFATNRLTWAAEVHRTGVRIRTLEAFYEEWLTKLPVSELRQISLLCDIGELHSASYTRAKRVFDVALSLTLMPALALSILVVLTGNRVSNPGPLFFRQSRTGRDGVRFTILKFRTMRMNSNSDGFGTWTRPNDARVTPFGRIMPRIAFGRVAPAVEVHAEISPWSVLGQNNHGMWMSFVNGFPTMTFDTL